VGGSAEELVYAQAEGGVEVEGVRIPPSPGPAAVAVVWIGGNSVRFYFPSYVRLGVAAGAGAGACAGSWDETRTIEPRRRQTASLEVDTSAPIEQVVEALLRRLGL
jgi:hypothetical protein